MRFAVINADADALALARTWTALGHELTLVADCGELRAPLRALGPDARIVDGWEDALAAGVDAVVVGRSGDEAARLERLRLLIQESVPTVLVHPQSTSALAYYELDMHRQATNSPLVPYAPRRHHPVWAKLAAVAPLEEATFEVRTRQRSRSEILERFVRDIGALRSAVGSAERVSAVGSLPVDCGDGRLGVQITTDGAAIVRWSIGSAAGDDESRLRFTSAGTAGEIDVAADGRRTWRGTTDGVAETVDYEPDAALQPAAAAVAAALVDPQPTLWREALADLELVEAVERSARRGRTVELFHEEASEQGTFKGLMAAGGCLLLVAAIMLAITAAVFGRFKLLIANAWPYALLAVLVVFLGLQLLKFAFPPEPPRD